MNRHLNIDPASVKPIPPHAAKQTLPPATALGAVHLDVTDADNARAFWTRYIGLSDLGDRDGAIRLGIDGEELIVLHPGATGPVVKRRTGLYHVAIHVPGKKDLARLAARLYALGWEHAPTDHTETAATYTNDPDGNGIEITFETPERGNLAQGNNQYFAILNDGTIRSGTEPLDVDDLLSTLDDDDDIMAPMPTGTRIGHVHLHVNDLVSARTFFIDTLGFGDMRYFESFHMSDFSLETSFVPHALAINLWNGRGAQPKPEGTAGLRFWSLQVPSDADLKAISERLSAAGHEHSLTDGVLEAKDPAGNTVRIIAGED